MLPARPLAGSGAALGITYESNKLPDCVCNNLSARSCSVATNCLWSHSAKYFVQSVKFFSINKISANRSSMAAKQSCGLVKIESGNIRGAALFCDLFPFQKECLEGCNSVISGVFVGMCSGFALAFGSKVVTPPSGAEPK